MRMIQGSGLVLSLLTGLAGCNEPVSAPKSFQDYTAKDGSFTCKYPAGWTVEGGGGSRGDYACTIFSKGMPDPGRIRPRGLAFRRHEQVAESCGGRGGTAHRPGPPAPEKGDRRGVHQLQGTRPEAVPDDRTGRGSQVQLRRRGHARREDLRLCRATLLANDKRITILCQCDATDWETLKPAFDKVIESLGR